MSVAAPTTTRLKRLVRKKSSRGCPSIEYAGLRIPIRQTSSMKSGTEIGDRFIFQPCPDPTDSQRRRKYSAVSKRLSIASGTTPKQGTGFQGGLSPVHLSFTRLEGILSARRHAA